MRKQFVILWVSILLLSFSLLGFLILGLRQRQNAASVAALPPTATLPALVVAPTRARSDVAAVPTALDLPTLIPTAAATVVPAITVPTHEAGVPRVFLAANTTRSQNMLANYCIGFGSPVSLRLFDWMTGSTVSLSDEAIARIPLSWDASQNIWQGYSSARPFNQPDDTLKHWKVNLFLPDGSERWIEIAGSAQTPDVYYVYTFQKTDPFAARNGDHYGYHPCRAFALPASEIQAFLTTIEQYQDVVYYPPLLSSDDPRWVLGIADPVVANADLRSIPSTVYNDPIASIDAQVMLWYALDPAWGSWAQVKLGSVQGWVDMGLVKLTMEG